LDVSAWNSEKLREVQSKLDTNKALKDASKELFDSVSKIIENTVGEDESTTASTVGEIFEYLPDIDNRDPQIALGSTIQIIGKISKLGKIMPGILGPLCDLASKALLSGEGEMSIESRLEKVIGEAFTEYQKTDLASKSWAVFVRLKARIAILSKILGSLKGDDTSKKISDFATNLVSGSEFLTDGIYELEILWYVIDKKIREAESKEEGKIAADYLFFYVMISSVRMQELALLSCLYQEVKAEAITLAVQSLINDRIETDGKRFKKLFGAPKKEQSKNQVYRAIHSPDYKHRALIEKYGNTTAAGGFKGRLIRINTKRDGKKSWLQCKEPEGKECTVLAIQSKNKEDGTLFRYFEDSKLLFSCNEGAYVFRDREANRKGKHFVNAYHKPVDRMFFRGKWRLPENDSGKIEFQYADKGKEVPWSSIYVSSSRQTDNNHFRIRTGPEEPEDFIITDVP